MSTTTLFRAANRSRQRTATEIPSGLQSEQLLAALGLAGEVGEVCEPIKKHVWHGKPLDREALILECGDVLWYLDRLLGTINATLDDAIKANIAKLDARYPDGWKTVPS